MSCKPLTRGDIEIAGEPPAKPSRSKDQAPPRAPEPFGRLEAGVQPSRGKVGVMSDFAAQHANALKLRRAKSCARSQRAVEQRLHRQEARVEMPLQRLPSL
jgi:hypothetical protein